MDLRPVLTFRFLSPRPLSALATVALAVALLAGLLPGFRGTDRAAQATGPGAPEAGFDMVSTGANTGTTLGPIETCVSVPATVGGIFTIDTFLDAVPAGEDLQGWNYGLEFPDSVVKLVTAAYSVSVTPVPPSYDLSEGAGAPGPGTGDDLVSPQNVTIAVLGSGSYTPAGTLGVLGRYTFQVTAATVGTYSFSFTPGLTDFMDSTGGNDSDWVASVNFANYGIGFLALGVPCPVATDVRVDSVTAASPGIEAAGTAFTVTADAALNKAAGGGDPVNVDTSLTLSLPPDCATSSANPAVIQDTSVSDATKPVSLPQQSWLVACTLASNHVFIATATATTDDPAAFDPNPGDNTLSSTGATTAITGTADLAATGISVSSSGTPTVNAPFTVSATASVANNGVYGPATADVTMTLITPLPPDCSGGSSNPQTATVSVLAGGSAPVTRSWFITCTLGGNHSFSASATVAVNQLHVSDPVPGNEGPVTDSAAVDVAPDADGDGVGDPFDNCPTVSNPGQSNVDGDTAGDSCDTEGPSSNANGIAGADDCLDGVDNDGDALMDGAEPTCDRDGDSVRDGLDNCPNTPNTNQSNTDSDSLGDVCDTEGPFGNSSGLGGMDDCIDGRDNDGDGLVDGFEPTCDSDGDTIPNPVDNCPNTPNTGQQNNVHTGTFAGDACENPDGDSVFDVADNCPDTPNSDQTNTDGDSQGDACDANDDNDDLPDSQDSCPTRAEDYDDNQDYDGCPESDNDLDGICDPWIVSSLSCSSTVDDACPNVAEDPDAFKDGDGCREPDNDQDGFPDLKDQCPGTDATAGVDGIPDSGDETTLTREDFEGVSDGDGCNDSGLRYTAGGGTTVGLAGSQLPFGGPPDGANDGCPNRAEDYDDFQDGDGCPDSDNDSDGICDPWIASSLGCSGSDACPNVAEDVDSFMDGTGCPDSDNDSDGFPDTSDRCQGTDFTAGPNGVADNGDEPMQPLPTLTKEDYDGVIDSDGCHDSPGDDFDGDGLSDQDEVFVRGTSPLYADTDIDGIGDAIDLMGVTPSTSFSDQPGGTTFGEILDRAGLSVTVSEKTNPAGVRVSTAGVGGGTARFLVCGSDELQLTSGREVEYACNSVDLKVIAGPATVLLGGEIQATLATGADVSIQELSPGVFQVNNLPGSAGSITIEATTLPPAGSITVCSGNSDCDGDSVLDGIDNCRTAANSTQANTDDLLSLGGASTPGRVIGDAFGDSCDTDDDDDGFSDTVEMRIGTNPLDNCATGPGTGGDAWPLDNNADGGVANVVDVLAYKGKMPHAVDATHVKRLDLDDNNFLNVSDVLKYKGKVPSICN